jgi:hypothetical protein
VRRTTFKTTRPSRYAAGNVVGECVCLCTITGTTGKDKGYLSDKIMASNVTMHYQGHVHNLPVRFSFGTQYPSIKNARSQIKESWKIKTDVFFVCFLWQKKGTLHIIQLSSPFEVLICEILGFCRGVVLRLLSSETLRATLGHLLPG